MDLPSEFTRPCSPVVCQVLSPLLALAAEGSLQHTARRSGSGAAGDAASEPDESSAGGEDGESASTGEEGGVASAASSQGGEDGESASAGEEAGAASAASSQAGSAEGSRQPLLVIDKPLAGYSEQAVALLLTFVYTPGSEDGASSIKAAAAAEEWDLLAEVVRLEDQLDAPGVLRTVERVLLECLPQETQAAEGWLPLLALADAHYMQLPALYRR